MGKEVETRSCPDYQNLIYFRWKALIRSQEYREFCNKVDEFLKKKGVFFTADADLYSAGHGFLSFEALLKHIEEYGLPVGLSINAMDDIEDYKVLISEMRDLEDEEFEILGEAENQFGIIAWDIEALQPVDKPVESLSIAFKDYLPAMPNGHSMRRFYEENTVREVRYKKGEIFILNADSEYKFSPGNNQRLFCINMDMPPGLIIGALKKKLMLDTEKRRADRKEFKSWEIAFKVWDIDQQNQNLLITAKAMGWKYNRKGVQYTDEDLRSLADKKKKVAEELITLAGQGKFKSL